MNKPVVKSTVSISIDVVEFVSYWIAIQWIKFQIPHREQHELCLDSSFIKIITDYEKWNNIPHDTQIGAD